MNSVNLFSSNIPLLKPNFFPFLYKEKVGNPATSCSSIISSFESPSTLANFTFCNLVETLANYIYKN